MVDLSNVAISVCVSLFTLSCFALWEDYNQKGIEYCVEHYTALRLIRVAVVWCVNLGIHAFVYLCRYRVVAFLAYWLLGYPVARFLDWWKPDFECGFRAGCGCGRNANWLDATGRQLQFMESSCSLCLGLYEDDVELNGFAPLGIILHCCHIFHEHCILRHLRMQNHQGRTMNCPICRRDVIGNQLGLVDYTPDGKPHEHTNAAQFERMKAQIRRGREEALASGVPEKHLVYVVRNNPLNHPGAERTMGHPFIAMKDAIDACRFVLEVNHLYRFSLYDIRVVDGRSYANVEAWITNPDPHAYELMRQQPFGSRAPSTRARRPPRVLDL